MPPRPPVPRPPYRLFHLSARLRLHHQDPPTLPSHYHHNNNNNNDNNDSYALLLRSPTSKPPPAKANPTKTPRQEPEKPSEPDNCCMSGCVNCVWDAYREEVEAWAAKGGGGEGEEGRLGGEGLFEEVPVGIREFMRLEKRIGGRKGGERERGEGRSLESWRV